MNSMDRFSKKYVKGLDSILTKESQTKSYPNWLYRDHKSKRIASDVPLMVSEVHPEALEGNHPSTSMS